MSLNMTQTVSKLIYFCTLFYALIGMPSLIQNYLQYRQDANPGYWVSINILSKISQYCEVRLHLMKSNYTFQFPEHVSDD